MPPTSSMRVVTPGLVVVSAAALLTPIVVASVAAGHADDGSTSARSSERLTAVSGTGSNRTADDGTAALTSVTGTPAQGTHGRGSTSGGSAGHAAAGATGAAAAPTSNQAASSPAGSSSSSSGSVPTTTTAAPTQAAAATTPPTVLLDAAGAGLPQATITILATQPVVVVQQLPPVTSTTTAATPGPITSITADPYPTAAPVTTGPAVTTGPVTSAGTTYGPTAGWHSGASGDSASSGLFSTWRGKPIQVAATWGDTSADDQTRVTSLDAYNGFDGDMDVAIGALAPGDTWAQAAQGAYSERWRAAVRSIAARRSGKAGTTYVRFAHELNGDWFTWKVLPGDLEAFHAAWRLYRGILAQEFPAAKLVFSPSNGSHNGVPVEQLWPGDDVVDVVGVDFYDGWPDVTSPSDWDANLNTMQGSDPYGVGSWQAFAARHGKPLSFPEWGLRSGDHPAFIQGMHDFLAAHAAQPGSSDVAGKVVYDIYFDIANGGNGAFMITSGANPQAAALYRSLSWGV